MTDVFNCTDFINNINSTDTRSYQ